MAKKVGVGEGRVKQAIGKVLKPLGITLGVVLGVGLAAVATFLGVYTSSKTKDVHADRTELSQGKDNIDPSDEQYEEEYNPNGDDQVDIAGEGNLNDPNQDPNWGSLPDGRDPIENTLNDLFEGYNITL